jgi:hypothetical protein
MRRITYLLIAAISFAVNGAETIPATGPAPVAPGKDAQPAAPVLQAGPAGPAAPAVAPAAGPAVPENTAEWVKIETKAVPFSHPRQHLTPGLLDPELYHIITFPKDGSLVDLDLPHFGKDKAGNPYSAIKGAFRDGGIWIDVNANGRVDQGEGCVVNPTDGYSDAFICDLHYDDGSTGSYIFRMKTVVDKEQYAIIRCTSRTAEYKGHKIHFIDDNGNGKYDDAEKDSVIIDDNPVTFLGKYIQLGEDFFETLVHTGGNVVEIRPAPKMELGNVNMFDALKLLQKAENLKVETLVIKSANSSFSFDERRRTGKVPTGAYDLAFGIIERNKEVVYVKKGDKSSFNVMTGDNVLPKYGGKITATVDIDADGEEVTIKKPQFTGEGSEHYFPENYNVGSVLCSIGMVFINPMLRADQIVPFAGSPRKFEKLPNGELKPLVLRRYRDKSEEYRVDLNYDSGIMGPVTGRQKFQFEYHKKEKDKDKDKTAGMH